MSTSEFCLRALRGAGMKLEIRPLDKTETTMDSPSGGGN
jgi:hypothetical protein